MDVSIIIVNWNTGTLLRTCLDRIPEATTNLTSEVLIIDNASSDQSIAHAEGSEQPFRLFAQTKNLGFSRANNVGIRQATGEIILLLNPDTEPLPGSITALVEFIREHEHVAAVGPRLLNTDGTLQPSCRRFPGVKELALMFLKIHHVVPNLSVFRRYLMVDFGHDVERRVDQIMGAAMAIPRDAMESVGLLDEGYWIWFEEVDWCKRAVAAGKEIRFTPRSEIIHHGGASFKQVWPVKKQWRFARASIRYAFKHLGFPSVVLLSLLTPLALILDALSFLRWARHS